MRRIRPLFSAYFANTICVNGNWRLTFEFDNGSAHILDYEDYH